MKLMIESGHEADLVTKGNWFNIKDEMLFEQLVVNRYKPVHVIDGFGAPRTRRLYGEPSPVSEGDDEYCEAIDDWLPTRTRDTSKEIDPAHGAFQYDAARFDPLVDRARKLAMAWLWEALKDNAGALDVAVRAKMMLWPEGRRDQGGYDRLGAKLLGDCVMQLADGEAKLLLKGYRAMILRGARA